MTTGDAERKVAFVLEHRMRTEHRTAEAFIASFKARHFTLADYQQRVQALRMFGGPLEGIPICVFCVGLTTLMIPRLVYVANHACDRRAAHCACVSNPFRALVPTVLCLCACVAGKSSYTGRGAARVLLAGPVSRD